MPIGVFISNDCTCKNNGPIRAVWCTRKLATLSAVIEPRDLHLQLVYFFIELHTDIELIESFF